MSASYPHVLVVGAGIVGAAIAWNLARTGARVTVLDAGSAGGLATRASLAWINASYGNPEPYFHLRMRAMAEWRTLHEALPAVPLRWSGGLLWNRPRAALEELAARHAGWGYAVRAVEQAEIARMEPALAAPPAFALYAPEEGMVEPVETARILLDAARTLGAELIEGRRVLALETAGGKVTGLRTDAGSLAADEVVLAAGTGTGALAASAGVTLPMLHSPALQLTTKPLPPLLNGLILPPDLELRQTAGGRLIAVADIEGSDAEAAAATLDVVRRMLKPGIDIAPEGHRVGERPVPGDRFPALGRAGIDGLYLAVTHSGVTLAPILGLFAAGEILKGERDPLLAPYGPDRF